MSLFPRSPEAGANGDQQPSSRAVSRRAFLGGVAASVVISPLLAACGTAQAEKPPAASPAVPGETPAPSEGNPVETPDNGEKDPLSPENLWSMSEKELLEAVRIPEGTPPEEWVQLYAKYRQALLNAIANQDAYEEWSERIGLPNNTSAQYAKYVFNKFVGPLEQLEGSTINRNGPTTFVLRRAAIMLYARSTETWGGQPPVYAIAPHITVEAKTVPGPKGGVAFEEVFHDNITDEYLEWFENNIGMDKNKFGFLNGAMIMSKEPTTRTVKELSYDSAEKTMQPSGWGAPEAKN